MDLGKPKQNENPCGHWWATEHSLLPFVEPSDISTEACVEFDSFMSWNEDIPLKLGFFKQNRHLVFPDVVWRSFVQEDCFNDVQLREKAENGSTQLERLKVVETEDLTRRCEKLLNSQHSVEHPL